MKAVVIASILLTGCSARISQNNATDGFQSCAIDENCLVDIPESQCADGTQSFFTVTKRQNADNLLIYLPGGGACWSKETCDRGMAQPLTREERTDDWENGGGIFNRNDPLNPFANSWHQVSLSYCTGDTYAGNREVTYRDDSGERIVHHKGYPNTIKALDQISTEFTSPEKVVVMGCSAGGIGAFYHLRNVAERYPNSQIYVVTDAGVPLIPPYIRAEPLANMSETWGTHETMPDMPSDPTHYGDLIRWNKDNYPHVKYGLAASLFDRVMRFYGIAVGTRYPLLVVNHSLNAIADEYISQSAENSKVFFLRGRDHCISHNQLDRHAVGGVSFGTWLNAMINDDADWQNRRP